jgi:hypothetical protein
VLALRAVVFIIDCAINKPTLSIPVTSESDGNMFHEFAMSCLKAEMSLKAVHGMVLK